MLWLDYSRRLRTDAQTWAHVLAIAAGDIVLWKPAVGAERARRGTLALSAACTFSALSAAAHWHVGAMVRCALALIAIDTGVWWQRGSARPWLGPGLLMLGIPALGQNQELRGASVRISVAEAAAALVCMPGVAVVAEGTRLSWAGGAVEVDAPLLTEKVVRASRAGCRQAPYAGLTADDRPPLVAPCFAFAAAP